MKLFLIFLLLTLQSTLYAQPSGQNDTQLAQYYYANGDFEKAIIYYEKLYAKDPSKQLFLRYVECLSQVKQFKTAEKIYKRQINSNRQDLDLKVSFGQFYEDLGEAEKATDIYAGLIKNLPPSPTIIVELYRSFISKKKLDLALECLKKGEKITSSGFEIQFADLFFLRGEKQEMIKVLIEFLSRNPEMIDNVEELLASKLDLEKQENADYIVLKDLLVSAAQKNNSPIILSELVSWLFIQSKNFNAAYSQIVSLEKRFNGDGYRVYDLATICMENNAFEAARKCYNYLMNITNSEYVIEAQRGLLNTRYLEITTNRNYNEEEINTTIAEYEQALARFGKQPKMQAIIIEFAHILAYYAGKTEKSIAVLTEAISINGLTDMQKAQIKMQLADIYVLGDDIWEASLLYMQVDKDFKFEAIGNNFQAMFWFAQSELLIEQHKYKEAFSLMDSIRINFPYHSLADEMLMRKGKAMEMQGKWQDAVAYYEDVLTFHSRDILADDALFRIADIKETILGDKEQALASYKRLLIDYRSSLFGAEARKRVRILRGDQFIDSDL